VEAKFDHSVATPSGAETEPLPALAAGRTVPSRGAFIASAASNEMHLRALSALLGDGNRKRGCVVDCTRAIR